MEKQPTIKILVGYHKPATLLKSDILVPIHLGRAVAKEASKDGVLSEWDYQWMVDNMIGDDTGENISSRNRELCEMTGLYWVWKNYEQLGNPDYIGFMHYRRIFDFTNKSQHLPLYKELSLPYVDHLSDPYEFLNADSIRQTVKASGCIISKHFVLNPVKKFKSINYLNYSDYNTAISLLNKYFPQYAQYADNYNQGNKCFFCNTIILPRETFFLYAEYMFKILLELENKIDKSNYTTRQVRMSAYISEWLTGIFFTYLSSTARVHEVPVLYIKEPDIAPILRKEKEGEISIVMACDDNYAPYLSTTIQSISEHITLDRFYKIYVLEKNISPLYKKFILSQQKDNFHISFVNLNALMRQYPEDIWYLRRHFSGAVYYRLWIPELFKNYEKVVYCDSDTIFLKDIAELYDVELENNYLGAVADTEIKRQLHEGDNYYYSVLKLKKPQDYFNSGLLLYNISKLNTSNIISRSIKALTEIKTPRCVDQDILNMVFEGKVKLMDERWNVEIHLVVEHPRLSDMLSSSDYYTYCRSLDDPKCVHFTSGNKPWLNPMICWGYIFWEYAKKTPFYEIILDKTRGVKQEASVPLSSPSVTQDMKVEMGQLKKAMKELFLLPIYRRKLKLIRFRMHFSWGKRKRRYTARKNQLETEIGKLEAFCGIK